MKYSNYSYIVIDDEEKAINLLCKIISKHYPDLECVGKYSSWKEALNALTKNDFDLVFLDISMPQKTGITLLELVPELKGEIIFVTAHEEHALKALNFSPTGYVLKPINEAKLVLAIDKAVKRTQDKKLAARFEQDKVFHNTGKIGIINNRGLDYINIEEVIFFQATSRCTKIVTTKKEYLSSNNIGKFKPLIDHNDFFSVHRSYIINIKKVKRYEHSGIVFMEDGHEIPVAKSNRKAFLRLFEKV